MNFNKVSIIVPVYNCETTISRCVNSVLNQTYNNIELILINDGSKDSSDYICKKYDWDDIVERTLECYIKK